MPDKLGIIAGRGQLPRWLISACQDSGRPCFVLAIHNQTDPETVAQIDHHWIQLGDAADGFRALHQAGVVDLVLAGAITKPSLKDLKPDARTRRFLRKLMWNGLGDDNLLRQVIQELEEEGFRVVGVQDILTEILAPGGVLGTIEPRSEVMARDIPIGIRAAMALGMGDAGQAVLVRDGRVIGLEDVQGTAQLIARHARTGSILFKMKKPRQERRVDLPTIGPDTVRQCIATGCQGIVVQEQGAILLDRAETIRLADQAGLFVLGVPDSTEDLDSWPNIYVIAGEASGDVLGGRLMEALRRLTGGRIIFHGVGGVEMTRQGLRTLFPMSELSLMGLAEILPHLPRLLARIRQTRIDVLQTRPIALVTIDSPAFSLRVSRSLAGHGIKLIHYVAPSVWAWKPGRAKKLAQFLDHLLTLLPFEPPYFEKEGLSCTFVGHPVTTGKLTEGRAALAEDFLNLEKDQCVLCLLPGSRQGEVRRLLPIFRETVSILAESVPDLVCVLPQAPDMDVWIGEMTRGWPVPLRLVAGGEHKADIFARADVALAASGTVAIELAVAGTPNVVAYAMNPLTAWLARRLVKSRYFNLINIILGEMIVPERFQEECRPEILARDLKMLITSETARSRQRERMRDAVRALTVDSASPAEVAARKILDVIDCKVKNGEGHE